MIRRPLLDRAALVLGALALLMIAAPRLRESPGLIAVALVSVPLVVADVRGRRLPNALTLPLLVAGVAFAPTGGTLLAILATVLGCGALHAAGGLGFGDVKLQAALAPPLAALGPDRVAAAPTLAFVLAGLWALALRSRDRIAFGPFQLAAFWFIL